MIKENKEQKKPSILLVDEDTFLLSIYVSRLKNSNWDTDCVTSAQEAEEILKKRPIDVLVLDVMVGKLPGVEILRSFKEKNIGGRVATIILSNDDDISNIEKAARLGADGYIVKAHNTPAEVAEEIEKIYRELT